MALEDRIVMMKGGVVQQMGEPMELFEPAGNKFVAGFIGSPQINFYDIRTKKNGITFSGGKSTTLPDTVMEDKNSKK